MKKGIIFFDLDGTLLNRKSLISPENKQLIKRLTQNGYLLIIASGRSPKEIREITKDTVINSYVSLNGQYAVLDDKVLANHVIETETIRKFIRISEKLSHPVAFYTPENYYINFIDQATRKLYAFDNAPLPKIDPDFYQKEPINMLYLFNEVVEDDALMADQFKDELTFYRDSPYSLAIVNKGRSKKAGIQDILTALKAIDHNNTFAFGDGNNDLSMFEAVKHPIAMGNANDQVKAAAEFVTGDHDGDGILTALQHYELI